MRKVLCFVAALMITSSLLAAPIKQAEEVRQLAEQGDIQAQVKLARMYEVGQSVPKDFNEALKWYKEAADHRNAAEQGQAMSQLNLAVMYDDGIGVATNKEEAVKWYRLAADQGEPRAQL